MRFEWLVIGVTLAVTFSTFGYPLLFDRLLFGLLIVTALVSFKWDKNLFALCIIYMGELVIEETGWFLLNWDRLLMLPAYVYLLVACWISLYSVFGKLSLMVAVCAISAEIYWYFIGQEGPEIFWHVFISANVLMVKHLVLIRPHFCSLRFANYCDEWKITKTDVDIGYLIVARLILEFLTIGEYLVRHVLDYPMMAIYNIYPYVGYGILALTFYLFLRSLSESVRTKLFSA